MRRFFWAIALLLGFPSISMAAEPPLSDTELQTRIQEEFSWTGQTYQYRWTGPWQETLLDSRSGARQAERTVEIAFKKAEDGTQWIVEMNVQCKGFQQTPEKWAFESFQIAASTVKGLERPSNPDLEHLTIGYLRRDDLPSEVTGTVLSVEGLAIEQDPTQFFCWALSNGKRIFRYSFFIRLLTLNSEDNLLTTKEREVRLFHGDQQFLVSLFKRNVTDSWRVDKVQPQGVAYRSEVLEDDESALQPFPVADLKPLTWSRSGWDRVWKSNAWKDVVQRILTEQRKQEQLFPAQIADLVSKVETLMSSDRVSFSDLEPFFVDPESASDALESWRESRTEKRGIVKSVDQGTPRIVFQSRHPNRWEARIEIRRNWMAKGSTDPVPVDAVLHLTLSDETGGKWLLNGGYEKYPF